MDYLDYGVRYPFCLLRFGFFIFLQKKDIMANLNFTQKQLIEEVFGMGGGYFLDFSNREFNEFMKDVVDYSIMLPKFWTAGQTKKVNFAA